MGDTHHLCQLTLSRKIVRLILHVMSHSICMSHMSCEGVMSCMSWHTVMSHILSATTAATNWYVLQYDTPTHESVPY